MLSVFTNFFEVVFDGGSKGNSRRKNQSRATKGGAPTPPKGPQKQPEVPQDALEWIRSFEEVPTYDCIHTSKYEANGREQGDAEEQRKLFTLNEEQRKMLIAVGTHKSAAILVDPEFFHTRRTVVRSLEGYLRNNNVRIERVCFADKKLIASLYETQASLAQHGLGGESGGASEQLWRELIEYGFHAGATDMHALLDGRKGIVKYRINGDLVPPATQQKGVYTREALRDAIAYAYNKLHAEKTQQGAGFSEEMDQQCMIPTRVGETSFNLRYQGNKLLGGYAVFIRYLTAKDLRMTRFQDAGYSEDQEGMLDTAVRAPFGVTAIAGITGSGKSTTLKFAIESIPDSELLNIMTVESPVEYPIRGAKQTTLQDGEQETWRQTQKKLVRSDPDVLMISEVRCVHSGETAKTMSETGHPVFFTVHAGSVLTVFSRLCDPSIGFTMETLTTPGFWQLIVYQALVPLLCDCKLPARGQIDHILDYIGRRFEISTDKMHVKNPVGCPKCRHTGVIGQTVVAEMMQPDRQLLELLRERKLFDAEKLWRSRSDGRFDSPDMRGKTVFQHALYKAFLGQVDPRVVERFTAFDRFEIL